MATNFCRAVVSIQPLCSGSWTDISGLGAAVSWDGGEVHVGEEFTFGDDNPQITTGKHGRVNVTVRVVYTEDAAEATELVRGVYEGGCARGLCLRWTPLGETAPNKVYTTISGSLITPTWPQGEAGSADPTMIEFTVTAADIAVADYV